MVGKCSKRRRGKRSSTSSSSAQASNFPTSQPSQATDVTSGNASMTSPSTLDSWQALDASDLFDLSPLTTDNVVNSAIPPGSATDFEDLDAFFNYEGNCGSASMNRSVTPLAPGTDNDSASANSAIASLTSSSAGSSSALAAYAGSKQLSGASDGCGIDLGPGDRLLALRVCFNKIASIETQLRQGKRAVDELMDAGQNCAQELFAAIQSDSYLQCAACPMLMLTAIELLTSLYEQVAPRLGLAGDSSSLTPMSNGTQSSDLYHSTLRLGRFQADPEDAADVWRHLMVGEVRRISRLLDAVATRRPEPHGYPRHSRAVASYRTTCEHLQQRINALQSTLQKPY